MQARGHLELNGNGPRLLLSGVKKRLNAYDSFNLIPGTGWRHDHREPEAVQRQKLRRLPAR